MKEVFNQFNDYTWNNIKMIDYKPAGADDSDLTFFNVTRQNIVETDAEIGFDVRYFECGRDGYSTLEKHEHVHVVVILRGQGKVVVGKKVYSVHPFDLIVISSWAPHQLINTGEEPFGFLCTVNGKRDKFQLLSEQEIQDLMECEETKAVIKGPESYLHTK